VSVLITGGYGCIGSWVVRLLLDEGRDVWLLDVKEDRHRLELLLRSEEMAKVRYIAGDVAEVEEVRRAIDLSGATRLLHLAGLQVPLCRSDPLRGARVNVVGTLAVFEAALAARDRIPRVVYASSAAVHGPAEAGASRRPVPDVTRLAPVTHYGAFKVANELSAHVYWLDHGYSSIGLRPWTVYGVGRDFVVTSEPTKAIQSVAAGMPYHISYGGFQDLQYVRDVAAAFVGALDAPFEGSEAYNIRGDVVSIEEFVATFEDAVPEARGRVTHGDRQLPIAPNLDDSRLQAAIGPLPKTALAAGIRETYERFHRLHAEGRIGSPIV
jgi:nucleoside-diphosphate-sugar epimerase